MTTPTASNARPDLLGLAERVEKASGPDRELDHRIALVAQDGRLGRFSTAEAWVKAATEENWNSPMFTASLDAAMTLYIRVPERIPSNPRQATAEALRQRAEEA